MYPSGSGSSGSQQQQGQQSQHQQRPWDVGSSQQQQQPPPPPQYHQQQQPQQPHSPLAAYPPPPQQPGGAHIRPQDRPHDMAALHPQQAYQHGPPPPQDPYRLPAPHSFYQQPPQAPQEQYRPQPQAQAQGQQSAPRQRTAIACKYCRRRKIRCSGFENSDDGRCSNCIRFSQECVFTPVSAQTQAFVPAQALYGRGRGGQAPPQQLYGAFGQRLPEGYPAPGPPPPAPQPGYPLPSPTVPQPYPYPPQAYPPPGYDPNAVAGAPPRRRGRDEPHTPTLPPPNTGHAAHMGGRPEDVYAYPDPSGYAPNSHPSASAYPQAPQPYYASQAPPRRTSPSSGYTYETSQARDSSSPHSSSYAYPAAAQSGPTPPPTSRPGMSIHDMVSGDGPGSGERSAADVDMVKALNRTRR